MLSYGWDLYAVFLIHSFIYWVLHFRNNNFVITWNIENHNHQNAHKQPRNCYQNELYCIWSLSCDRCGGFVTLMVCSGVFSSCGCCVSLCSQVCLPCCLGKVMEWSCLVFSSEYLHEQRLKEITIALDDEDDDQREFSRCSTTWKE